MGISPTQLIIILVIVALLFGTKKLRGMGGDLGGAVKGFKNAMKEDGAKKSIEDDRPLHDEPVAVVTKSSKTEA